MYFLNKESSDKVIKKSYTNLRKRILKRINIRSRTKLIAVQFINVRDKQNYQSIYRIHVFNNQIIGGYAVVNKRKDFHSKHMGLEDFSKFVEINKKLIVLLKNKGFKSDILNSIASY